MKNKILFGIMALVISVCMAGCSDDDYTINKQPLLTDNSVVTGSADVTATSATMYGTVSGLDGQSSSAYTTGFNYGDASDALTEKVTASGGAEFAATVPGSVNQTIYYQAYVTLQGKVTYKGEVKSLVLTNARAITGDATQVGVNKVTLAGSLVDFPTDAESGIIVSGVEGMENVRAGVRVATTLKDSYTVNVEGLLPNTTYHYVAYLDLGAGVVYGEEKSFTTGAHSFDLDNDLVDLGLSTKWAKYNVGATSESEIGGLFGFGDMTGFNTSLDPTNYASADIYKTANDLANNVFGGKVTMPTIDDFEELFTLCTKEWTEVEGVAGYKFTGPNGNSIFLPAAGSRTQGATTGVGVEGYYLSGSINVSDNQFAMGYHFNSAVDMRTTTPVYQALAIRPVSTAKNVPFVKELLYKTWEIDLKSDGSYITFHGPTYFYGMDDSWATVTNGEPVVGDSWCWDADFTGNSWAVGGSANNCRGTMTFSKAEDGTNKVVVSQVTADGTVAENKGTFTIDEENKTLTLDVDILAPVNYVPSFVNDKKTDIKILSLTESSMQLAVVRTDPSQDPALLSINYIPQLNKYGFTAKLTCYGGDAPDGWNSAVTTISAGEAGLGTYSITFNTETPRTVGLVYLLDIVGYATAYSNAMVRIDAIKADGNDVKFDASKFFYGDIEDNGNYRVEIANIWGCGGNDSNGLKDTPFREGGGDTSEETALAFNSTFEVTFTIASITSNGAGIYTPKLATVTDWAPNCVWDYNEGATFEVQYKDFQYSIVGNSSFDLKYEPAGLDYSAGSMMTFIEVADLYGFFPDTHATLDNLYLDDSEVPFNVEKVLDSNENTKYRLELWNCYGATKENGCAFGTPDGDVIKELGFNNSMQVKFTFHNLFAVPQW